MLLALLLAATCAACVPVQSPSNPSATQAQKPNTPPDQAEDIPEDIIDTLLDQDDGDTIEFTDSAGREVELPKEIERVAPADALAQAVLYTLCPDKIAGWASEPTAPQKKYIDDKYAGLPVFGSFYDETLDFGAVMTAAPQAVFEIGEATATIKEDMDEIQESTGIPTIFIKMDLSNMAEAYATLGELTGETEQAKTIADYVRGTLDDAKAKAATIPDAERMKVYFGQDDGLTAIAGGLPADVVDRVGAVNVVKAKAGGDTVAVSMEQLALWQPDAAIFMPGQAYGSIESAGGWKDLNAVKNGRFYEVPDGPYNWLGGSPASCVLGHKVAGKFAISQSIRQRYDQGNAGVLQDFLPLRRDGCAGQRAACKIYV